MAQKKRRIRAVIIFLLFIIYFFIAARPIPRETVLSSGWIKSLSSDDLGYNTDDRLLTFNLGDRFGYIDLSGRFAVNRTRSGNIYLGESMWTEYDAAPSNIEIKNIAGETTINIENPRGYPVLLDNRVFIISSDQNALAEIDAAGNIMWTYEFGSPLTCIDAAAGLVLTGSLDGKIEILNSGGERIYYFEPGGSRYEVILGCAISSSGSHFGIISGISPQRFMLFERPDNNSEYRVIHHEFPGTDFRRPAGIWFIDNDRRIVYERAGGIGCYSLRSRSGIYIPLSGEIAAFDTSGDHGMFFLITSNGFSQTQKELVGIKLPQDRRFMLIRSSDPRDIVFLRAPFKSEDVFLARDDAMLIAGGGSALISFNLEAK